MEGGGGGEKEREREGEREGWGEGEERCMKHLIFMSQNCRYIEHIAVHSVTIESFCLQHSATSRTL